MATATLLERTINQAFLVATAVHTAHAPSALAKMAASLEGIKARESQLSARDGTLLEIKPVTAHGVILAVVTYLHATLSPVCSFQQAKIALILICATNCWNNKK